MFSFKISNEIKKEGEWNGWKDVNNNGNKKKIYINTIACAKVYAIFLGWKSAQLVVWNILKVAHISLLSRHISTIL